MHTIQNAKLHQIFKTIMEKYTMEKEKVHLKSDMETIRNHSSIKNIGQIQNFGMNTGDLKNSKHNQALHKLRAWLRLYT